MKIIALLLIGHFIGDFVFQRNVWAVNKSKSNVALTKHVTVYTATLIAFSLILGWKIGIAFGLANGLMHWCTDYVTSRITSRLWKAGQVHNFFVVIGLDQLIHYLTMIGILIWWKLAGG